LRLTPSALHLRYRLLHLVTHREELAGGFELFSVFGIARIIALLGGRSFWFCI
jgi:hypothetical protein